MEVKKAAKTKTWTPALTLIPAMIDLHIPGALANPQKSKKTTLYIPIITILPQKADRGLCIYLLGYLVSA